MADPREPLDQELAEADRLAEEQRRGYQESEGQQPAPEPEPEPQAPEPHEPAGPEPEPAQQPHQPMVPQAALHEARQEMRRLEREVAELRGHLQASQQRPEPEQPKPDPYAALGEEPKYEDDPAAYLAWHQKKQQIDAEELRRQQKELSDWRQSQEQQSQQQREFQQFMGRYHGAVQEFSAQHPDWQNAYQHLLRSRDAELSLVGVPVERRAQQIRREEAELVAAAFEAGHNPAERLYELAKQRGWSAQAGAGNGQAPPSTPTAPAASAPAQQPAQQPQSGDMSGRDQARRAASRSLSDISGGPGGPLSATDIANMSESELLQKMDRDTFRRVMGG